MFLKGAFTKYAFFMFMIARKDGMQQVSLKHVLKVGRKKLKLLL